MKNQITTTIKKKQRSFLTDFNEAVLTPADRGDVVTLTTVFLSYFQGISKQFTEHKGK